MKFFDSVLNAFLSREQRERVSQSKWDKSVAQAARELGLDTPTAPTTAATTPRYTPPAAIPTSYPMTPSLSSSSTNTVSSSSDVNSPARSRPSTSYSTSPRPEFRRHLSIARQPISYDTLISGSTTKPRRASQDAAPPTHQLLYPLPPLGPMEGIGKDRRSVDVTPDYLDALQRNTIAALQPLRRSRFDHDNRDTTTPPRAYSASPPMERQLAMQSDLERWAEEVDAAAAVVVTPPPVVVKSRPQVMVRVAHHKRRAGVAGNTRVVGGIARNLKKGYKSKPRPREVDLSASMETLVSGEE